MKQKLFWLLLSISIYSVPVIYAQQENVWAFGTEAGLDFKSGTPVPVYTNMGVYPGASFRAFGESSASVCDPTGQLLFYTEGFYVWDRSGNVMPNGRDLTPTFGIAISYTPTSSTSQGVVIVPMPGNPNRYYVFSLIAREYWQQTAGRLYYSVVDMSLNGGLGDIVPGEKSILMDSLLDEKITATTGDHCNVWLLSCSITSSSSRFKAYEINALGLNPAPVISDVGLGSGISLYGTFVVAPDRKKIIATQSGSWGGSHGAALFDFDPGTGLASNPVQLLSCCPAYGACFSGDNTKVYVNTLGGTIYQFDLSSNDTDTILASRVELGTPGFSHLKLGPDGKIYFISNGPGGRLGVINFPNKAGTACGYTADALQLLPGQRMHGGLPNVVPVVKKDTLLESQVVYADCFANVNLLTINAQDSGGWDYKWNNGTYGPSLVVDSPGTYWVSYFTPSCVFNVDTFYVTFPNGVLPAIHIQNSCPGLSTGRVWASTYPDDTVTYHYLWRNTNNDTLSRTDTLPNVPSGNYTLHVATVQCDTILSFFLPEEDHKVSFHADSIICQGTEIVFQNTSDSDFSLFYWNFGNQDTSSVRNPIHTYPQSGSYEVSLTGIGTLCTDTVSKTIIVDSMFTGKFSTLPDSICAGESIKFYPDVDGHSIINLYWHFGDGIEMTSGNEKLIQHAYEVPGVMPVSLTVQYRVCPETEFTDSIFVQELPLIDLGLDTPLCLDGAPVFLQNRHSEKPVRYSYLWNTGDTTEILKVVHPGQYIFTVYSDPLGCSSSESVRIFKGCLIDIPNVFTPNGDGINDFFFPRQELANGLTGFHMQVFNRWGNMIFETKSEHGKGWDGKFNNIDQPQGVYYYMITVNISHKKETYTGNVTLLR